MRKIFMMGFAMMAGLPQPVCAKDGGRESPEQVAVSRSGPSGATPLRDYLTPEPKAMVRSTPETWHMAFGMPDKPSSLNLDPPVSPGTPVGMTFRLNF